MEGFRILFLYLLFRLYFEDSIGKVGQQIQSSILPDAEADEATGVFGENAV